MFEIKKVQHFKGWIVMVQIKNQSYAQIETLRSTRKDSIEKAVKLYALKESDGWDASVKIVKELWRKMRGEGFRVEKVTLIDGWYQSP